MFKIWPFLLFMLIFAFGCSSKKGQTKAPVSISVNGLSAIMGSRSNNGLILYGRTEDKSKVFTKIIKSDSADLVLPNGTWNFYAVSWESGAPGPMPDFTGKTYCGKSLQQKLSGSDLSISLNLTNLDCNDADFSAFSSNYGPDKVLPKPQIHSCKSLTNVLNNTSVCNQSNGNTGYATSYRIIAYEGASFDASIKAVKIAESACLRANFSSTSGGIDISDETNRNLIRIPTTIDNGLNLAVQIFYAGGAPGVIASCDPSSGVEEVPFNNPRLKTYSANVVVSNVTNYNLFVESNEKQVCRDVRLSPMGIPAGFGLPGNPYLICTPDQLRFLSTNFVTYKNSSYELGSDLDFGNTFFIPIGDPLVAAASGEPSNSFSGNFNGNNHKISNLKIACRIPGVGNFDNYQIGLFRSLNNANIKNLTINSANVNCEHGSQVGILAGKFNNNTTNHWDNIKINGYVKGVVDVGGLVGLNTFSSGNLILSNINVNADVNADEEGGGLIGEVYSVSGGGFDLSQSSFNGYVHYNNFTSNAAPSSRMGGIIGWTQVLAAPAINLHELSVKSNHIEGASGIGGAVGWTHYTNLQNIYIEANLQAYGGPGVEDLGGVIGHDEGYSSMSNVISIGTHTWPDGGSWTGNLIGCNIASPAVLCSNNYFITNSTNTGDPCSDSLSYADSKLQANYNTWNFPTTWTMPDEGSDVPRLSFETLVENDVPYLKRSCHGNYGLPGQPYPNLICTEDQLRASVGHTGSFTLGKNLYYEGVVNSFVPFPAGVYHLDGAGYSLNNFSFTYTNTAFGQGLFKELQSGSTIKNLVLNMIIGIDPAINSFNAANIGLLTGINSGDLLNIKLTSGLMTMNDSGSIDSGVTSAGGLVGRNDGSIKNSFIHSDISVTNTNVSAGAYLYTGNVAGTNNGVISNVEAHGSSQRFANCASAEAISLPSGEMMGGFVGANLGSIKLTYSDTHLNVGFNGSPSCTLTYGGHFAPYVAFNDTNGVIEDYLVNANFDNTVLGNRSFAGVVDQNSGTINRGFVIFKTAAEANRPDAPSSISATNTFYFSLSNSALSSERYYLGNLTFASNGLGGLSIENSGVALVTDQAFNMSNDPSLNNNWSFTDYGVPNNTFITTLPRPMPLQSYLAPFGLPF